MQQTNETALLVPQIGVVPGDESNLSEQMRTSIQDTDQQVVGVVVNAIDDHLEKSEQLETNWTRDGIKVLPVLLHEAKSAGRLVILVCDHGHIIECNTDYVPSEGGGERWRTVEGEPRAGELLIKGSRVVNEGQQAICPWTEKIRYTKGKKNGYHGGINPQEVVFPISVLSPTDDLPEGWSEATIEDPIWWDEQYFQQATMAPTGDSIEKVPVGLLFDIYEPAEKTDPQPQPGTETGMVSTTGGGAGVDPVVPAPTITAKWIDELFNSSIFETQKGYVTRGRPDDSLIRSVLISLEAQGGTTTSPALARAISMPPMRVRGLVSNMIRILNVDSYDILTFDTTSNTIELNKEMLLKQFGLD